MKRPGMGIVIIMVLSVVAFGQNILTDPGIPVGETCTYTLTIGDRVMTLVEKVETAVEKGKEIYIITSNSSVDDKIIKMERNDMRPYYIRHVKKTEGTVIERTSVLVKEGPQPAPDQVNLIYFPTVKYALRGFPFKEMEELTVIIQGGDAPFELKVTNKGPDTIKLGNDKISCFKIQVSMSGILGSLLPKNYYWFSAQVPHYLVRFEGSTGMPGSPKKTLVLKDYSAKK